MPIEAMLVQLAVLEMPDLIALVRATVDAIETKGQSAAVAGAAVSAAEVAADVLEERKFPGGE